MENGIRKISPAMFGVALICVFLPFVNLSCGGQKLASLTGIQLVTGTTIKQPAMIRQMFGQMQPQKFKGNPLAIISFLSAIAGLGLSFLKAKKNIIVSTIIAGIGAVSLILLKSKLNNDILREGGGMIQIEYTFGFWMVMLIFFAIGIINILSLLGILKKVNFGAIIKDVSLKGQPQAVFCSQCGAKVSLGSSFCSECGYSLK